MRRLNVLKARGWVRVIGSDDNPISPTARISQGESYEATVFEELGPVSSVPKQSHESEDGDLAELAMQQLTRLSRGKL
jgi:hypothetical protein